MRILKTKNRWSIITLGLCFISLVAFQNCSDKNLSVQNLSSTTPEVSPDPGPGPDPLPDPNPCKMTGKNAKLEPNCSPLPPTPFGGGGQGGGGSSGGGGTVIVVPPKPKEADSTDQERKRSLGYLLATDVEVTVNGKRVKADPTGSQDSTAALQAAIDKSYNEKKPLFIPPGTYLISDTLRVYKYQLASSNAKQGKIQCDEGEPINVNNPPPENYIIQGASDLKTVLKINPESDRFSNVNKPRPMIAFKLYVAAQASATSPPKKTASHDPLDHPFDDPRDQNGKLLFCTRIANLFDDQLRNLTFDTQGIPGAIGVFFMAAQDASIDRVRVIAEKNNSHSFAGFFGLPGRGMGATDIEVIGGKHGIVSIAKLSLDGKTYSFGSAAGSVVTAAKLFNQQDAPIWVEDFVPFNLVGFHIKTKKSGALIKIGNTELAGRAMSLVDGIVESTNSEALLIDNAKNGSFYLRNLYFKGFKNIYQKGSEKVLLSGQNNFIEEFTATARENFGNLNQNKAEVALVNLVDGQLTTKESPAALFSPQLKAGAKATPLDLVERHLPEEVPALDDGKFIAITDVGAEAVNDGITRGSHEFIFIESKNPLKRRSPEGVPNSTDAIERAISEAERAGHNRVFIPRGIFYIDRSIKLKKHTKLFGVGRQLSGLATHPSWKVNTGAPVMVESFNAVDSRNSLSHLSLYAASFPYNPENEARDLLYDRFGHVKWQAGRNSSIYAITAEFEFKGKTIKDGKTYSQLGSPKVGYHFVNKAGGRHYYMANHGPSGTSSLGYRLIKVEGTTEPLWFYAANPEVGKNVTKGAEFDSYRPEVSIEILNAKNINIFGLKREGRSPTAFIKDSSNIALYGSGAMRNSVQGLVEFKSLGLDNANSRDGGAYVYLYNSSPVVIANFIPQAMKLENEINDRFKSNLLIEKTNSDLAVIPMPLGVSLFKRGQLNLEAMK